MITFGIAEDEEIERVALSRFIGANFSDAQVVWAVGDGKKALACAHSAPTDVLVVDINMPVLDGLSLCEALSSEEYGGVVLINTAYDHFSYAQRALRYGVTEYILKPSSDEELRAVLSRCIRKAATQIRRRVDIRERMEKASSLIQYSEAYLYDRILDGREAVELLRDFGWPDAQMQTCAILLESKSENAERENQLRALFAARYARHAVHVIHTIEGKGHLLLIQPRRPYPPAQWRAVAECVGCALMQDLSEIERARISKVCGDPIELRRALAQITDAVPEAPEHTVIQARDASRALSADERMKLVNAIHRYLYDGEARPATKLLRTVWNREKGAGGHVLWELIALYAAAASRIGARPDRAWECALFSTRAPDDALFGEWLARARAQMLDNVPGGTSLDLVFNIMRAEFSKGLTQAEVAGRIGMSPAYFSRYFKRKTGRHFVDALTDIRIRHALHLLIVDPDLTIDQLAESCGFYSKTYFCEVFKRCVGKTVGQYIREDLRSDGYEPPR